MGILKSVDSFFQSGDLSSWDIKTPSNFNGGEQELYLKRCPSSPVEASLLGVSRTHEARMKLTSYANYLGREIARLNSLVNASRKSEDGRKSEDLKRASVSLDKLRKCVKSVINIYERGEVEARRRGIS